MTTVLISEDSDPGFSIDNLELDRKLVDSQDFCRRENTVAHSRDPLKTWLGNFFGIKVEQHLVTGFLPACCLVQVDRQFFEGFLVWSFSYCLFGLHRPISMQ